MNVSIPMGHGLSSHLLSVPIPPREFINAVEQQRDPCPGSLEGLASLAAIRAAYDSIETGAPVSPVCTRPDCKKHEELNP